MFLAEKDLHSGTARMAVLFHPKDSVFWRADTCFAPAGGVCKVKGKRHAAKLTIELHLSKDVHTTRKERDQGHMGGSSERRESSNLPQSKEVSRACKA